MITGVIISTTALMAAPTLCSWIADENWDLWCSMKRTASQRVTNSIH